MMRMSTGISPKYVKAWDAEKAIREIVQNYLDSRKEFECDGTLTWNDGVAVAKDAGPGLELRHLALGVSEKSGDSIGKYGEGLKLALLVFARLKRNIEIWANGKIIRPTIEFDENYQTDVMVLNVQDMEPRHAATHKGTSVKFECTETELETGKCYFENFLVRRDDFTWVEQGYISLPGGSIFINGAKVGMIENALFSYHLKEREVGDIGNRDREVIDINKLAPIVRRIIASTSSTAVMKAVMTALVSEKDIWEIKMGLNEWQIPQAKTKVWKKVYNEIIGKNVVLSEGDADMDTQARYKGYRVLKTSWSWRNIFAHIGVPTSASVVCKQTGGIKRVAVKNLTTEERSNLKRAISLVEAHYAEVGNLTIAEDLRGFVGAEEGTDVRGAYSREEDRIYLKRDILTSMGTTLHVVLHEAVHKHSGALDCTAEFEKALTEVAVEMMLRQG